MNSRFLDICQLEHVENGKGTGVLALQNYQGLMGVRPLFLALEGIHQAAVRIGKKVIAGASARDIRVLPVNINQFSQADELELKAYQFTCEAEPFGPSARVTVTVLDEQTGDSVAQAQITVAKL
ncbi:hypothetical protein [Pseudoalteromonas sp. MMG012]|uniref:hypothetical protein n=1 Tax=Pseudoalteromonas sp. MMG012 TaxID=2822686 RepID=UPI001B39DE61|nr:hypothetical protein [Pseudoalteromonas sp. MMG012]MBQ4849994.1 hypothetical protein [Pseudoalteromonas sp. MMG012]